MTCVQQERSKAPLTVGPLPADLFLRIMATACRDQPVKLLVCASVSHEFRAIAGSALHPAVNEIWGGWVAWILPLSCASTTLALHSLRARGLSLLLL